MHRIWPALFLLLALDGVAAEQATVAGHATFTSTDAVFYSDEDQVVIYVDAMDGDLVTDTRLRFEPPSPAQQLATSRHNRSASAVSEGPATIHLQAIAPDACLIILADELAADAAAGATVHNSPPIVLEESHVFDATSGSPYYYQYQADGLTVNASFTLQPTNVKVYVWGYSVVVQAQDGSQYSLETGSSRQGEGPLHIIEDSFLLVEVSLTATSAMEAALYAPRAAVSSEAALLAIAEQDGSTRAAELSGTAELAVDPSGRITWTVQDGQVAPWRSTQQTPLRWLAAIPVLVVLIVWGKRPIAAVMAQLGFTRQASALLRRSIPDLAQRELLLATYAPPKRALACAELAFAAASTLELRQQAARMAARLSRRLGDQGQADSWTYLAQRCR